MKFKVGDRVAAYFLGVRHTGFLASPYPDGTWNFKEKDDSFGVAVHSKQCRLLKRRERRRVYVEFDYETNKSRAVADTYEELERSWKLERQHLGKRYLREFIEVRKKGSK